MNQLERIFKAFANRRRIAIVRYLKKSGPQNVSAIACEIKLSLRATSRHLVKLAASDILEREQHSLEGYYRIARKQSREIKLIVSVI